jgi:hypothetical protein
MEHLERLLQQHFHLSENISRIYAQVYFRIYVLIKKNSIFII